MIAECERCKFWLEVNTPGGKAGQCRRHPPTIVLMGFQKPALEGQPPQPLINTFFPVMAASSWCGDYEPGAMVSRELMSRIDLDSVQIEGEPS